MELPVTLIDDREAGSRPVWLVAGDGMNSAIAESHREWAASCGFRGEAGKFLLVPGEGGGIAGALFGLGDAVERGGFAPLATGALARLLPAGSWHLANPPKEAELATLGVMLGGYAFTRYGRKAGVEISFAAPEGVDAARVRALAEGVFLTRDLINTPTNDMGPSEIEQAARDLAHRHGAAVDVIVGDDLLERNFPMIHAVGRASSDAPRLIDLSWGREDAPKVTLVGKGVAFDTGGLDIKPPSNMLLMKKDMGGAANVLGLAAIVMALGLDLRLRVLIPAVENAIAGNAFRPGDVLASRKGLTVEIGNTDAEGRLILADALAYADEDAPDLLIDMATLTGAARVALGPDLPPFFTDDDDLAAEIAGAAARAADPLWRLPLWDGYDTRYSSRIADINNVNADGFAGAIVAALFLRRFVGQGRKWVHFDVFGWSPVERPHVTVGGEAQAIRALADMLARRYKPRA